MDFKHFEARTACLGVEGVTPEVIQKIHNTIKNAMACGQSHCRVVVMKRNLHYRTIDSAEEYGAGQRYGIEDSVPFRNKFTMEIIDQGIRCELMVPVFPIVEYLRENGLQFTVTTLHHSSSTPIVTLVPWAELVALFLPDMNDASKRERPPFLFSLWNNIHTLKCLDASESTKWTTTVKNALVSGQSHAIVMLLWEESDYSVLVQEDSLVPTATSPFHCIFPRECYTLQLIPKRKCTLDTKFKSVIQWANETAYRWTLLFSPSGNGWAYFTILLEPQTVSALCEYN